MIFFNGISAADIKRNDSRPFQAIILDNWIFQKKTPWVNNTAIFC